MSPPSQHPNDPSGRSSSPLLNGSGSEQLIAKPREAFGSKPKTTLLILKTWSGLWNRELEGRVAKPYLARHSASKGKKGLEHYCLN